MRLILNAQMCTHVPQNKSLLSSTYCTALFKYLLHSPGSGVDRSHEPILQTLKEMHEYLFPSLAANST